MADLSANLDTVGIMVGGILALLTTMALVQVGVRLFKKMASEDARRELGGE